MFTILAALLLSLPQPPTGADGGLVYAKGKKFLAEVVRTPQGQARGLMYRQQLSSDRVMFFLYQEEGQRPIWMKNCLISLDVVWVDADGKIVELAEKCPPCSPMRGDDCPNYGGTVLSRHFVEFSAGSIRRLGLKKGDRLGWDLSFVDGAREVGGLQIQAKPRKKGRR